MNENKPKTLGLFRKVVYFWFIFEINKISFKSFGHRRGMTTSLQYIYFATMQEHEHRGEAGGDGEADPGVLGDQHRPQVRHSRQQGQQRGGSHPFLHIHPWSSIVIHIHTQTSICKQTYSNIFIHIHPGSSTMIHIYENLSIFIYITPYSSLFIHSNIHLASE